MLVKLLLPLFIFLKIVSSEEGTDQTCLSLQTYGYGYRQFYNLPRSAFKNGFIAFNFSLSAPSNGHVLLSEKANSHNGYEVVLGAGGNEYSELRKSTNGKLEPKTYIRIKNTVSPISFRNFSIVINDSIVSVYFMNDSKWVTLLTWKDRAPLDVEFLSFCSWTGVTGRWLFDCKGATAITENMTPLKKLRKKLLSKYDTYSVPATDINKLTIDTSIDLHYVSLDAKNSLLTAHGKFYFKWLDPRMQWNPKEYDNIESIHLLHREIWLPDFVLYNSQGRGDSPMGNAVIEVLSNGTVSWRPEAKMVTWCSLDLQKWPFDKHTCNISLGLNSHPDYVHVSLSSGSVKPELSLKNLEWKIVSLIGETTTIVNPWELDTLTEHPKAFSIRIELKRQAQMHVYSFIFPTVASIIIILASFWLPIFISKRLYLHGACLFLILFNIMLLDTALPALPSSTPYLLTVNSNLLIITVIHIIFCAYIISKVELYEEFVSKFVDRIVTHPSIQSLFCLFMDQQYYKMKEDSNFNLNGNVHQQMNQWMLFGIILDRIIFLLTIIYISVILIV